MMLVSLSELLESAREYLANEHYKEVDRTHIQLDLGELGDIDDEQDEASFYKETLSHKRPCRNMEAPSNAHQRNSRISGRQGG